MKVLMMIHGLPTAGAERNVTALLPRLRGFGVDVHLCTLSRRRDGALAALPERLGVPRFDLGARRLADPAALHRLLRLLRREEYAVVHAQDPASSIMAAGVNALARRPIVFTRHVLSDARDTAAATLRARLLHWSARLSCSRVIAVSEAVRQRFAGESGLPLGRIDTVRNGIDLEGFHAPARRADIRARLGWAPEDPVVIMVAVLRDGKGHEVLLDAVPRIRAAVPRARVVIVGDGPRGPELRAMAQPLGDAVVFLGERNDVRDLLAASDLLVLPSWSEALPNVLLEAGAAALPAVATDVGGIAEVVEDGHTGILIPPGSRPALADGVVRLLANPDLAAGMGHRARRRIETEFCIEEQARRTLLVYERAASVAHPPPSSPETVRGSA